MSRLGKKRKQQELDLELDPGTYNSFCSAASAVTQLYHQSVAAKRKAHAEGGRVALEKMMHWLVLEHGSANFISTAAVAQYLKRELEAVSDGKDYQWPASGGPALETPPPPPFSVAGMQDSLRRVPPGDDGGGMPGYAAKAEGNSENPYFPGACGSSLQNCSDGNDDPMSRE